MLDIYRKSFRYYWSVLPVLIAVMAVTETLLWYFEPKQPGIMMLVPMLLITYQFHRHFLFGETLGFGKPPEGAPPQKFGWFIVISIALLCIPALLAAALVSAIAPKGLEALQMLGLLIMVFAPIHLLSLSMFGTALPASMSRNGRFRMASGIKNTFGTMLRLIAGPGLASVPALGFYIALGYLSGTVPALQNTAGQLAISVLVTTASFLPSLLVVAVLCHMYQKIIAVEAEQNEITASHS
jgi:hypothetical protein